ncbi:Phytanoyl-CoA dioxygenase (PhyH) [Nesidiocoris tenuis]|uniref:phytanoyl-CoA dioxygenase n=2 Tax=Nesidiocoris tenuis TaxID=355587 RepID=A0ABN7ACK1_9HEMI|nr:Phytanoyl-CoA dioxygenase (PhyH) [Nesidiocoris tenuis]
MLGAERLTVIRGHLKRPSASALEITPTNAVYGGQEDKYFRYTLPSPFLNDDQRQFYEENGFIVIPKLIEDELLDQFSERFINLCDGRVPRGGITLMKDVSLMKKGATGERLYNKAQDIVYDEVFEKYFFHPKLLDYVSAFTGPNIKAVHTMLINKPPDAGSLTSRHPLHQDLYYFPFRPEDRIVAAWTAMERINVDNGCLVVLPGTHKGRLHQHDYPKWEGGVNKAYHGVLGHDDYKTVALTMEKGDTVFFHPLLIHGSGANMTNGFRKAISSHYAASECYYIDVKGTLQENISKEIEEMAKKKGIPLTMKEVWQLRSRLVRGEEGTL